MRRLGERRKEAPSCDDLGEGREKMRGNTVRICNGRALGVSWSIISFFAVVNKESWNFERELGRKKSYFRKASIVCKK